MVASVHSGDGTTIAGPSNVSIIGNSIHSSWGDGIYIGRANHLSILLNSIVVVGRTSIVQTAGSDIEAAQNKLQYAAGGMYGIETNGGSGDTAADSVARVSVHDNVMSWANTAGSGAPQYNGVLASANANPYTSVSDVLFQNNTSQSALILEEVATASGGRVGAVHRIEINNNSTTYDAGQLEVYGGRQHHGHQQPHHRRPPGRAERQLGQRLHLQPAHAVHRHPPVGQPGDVRYHQRQHLRRRQRPQPGVPHRLRERQPRCLPLHHARLLNGAPERQPVGHRSVGAAPSARPGAGHWSRARFGRPTGATYAKAAVRRAEAASMAWSVDRGDGAHGEEAVDHARVARGSSVSTPASSSRSA